MQRFDKGQIIKIIVLAVFLLCTLFANFYAVRKMVSYGVEIYLYDKLLVAYNIGGQKGLKTELQKIFSDDKFPHELVLARDFEIRLRGLKDPAAYLSDRVEKSKKKAAFIRGSRTVAIVLMFLIFGWRMFANLMARSKYRMKYEPEKKGNE